MQEDVFVIDGVAHAFDMSPANFADERLARPVNDSVAGLLATAPDGYRLDPEETKRDWTVEDTANILFRESGTDVAVFHTTPIYFFKDGWSGWHKSVEAAKRWPDRFIGAYCAVDPLRPDPIGDLERQVEELQPLGVKLYPISYTHSHIEPWRMDDPKIAFPIYERAAELGIKHIAVHKAVPLGPTPGQAAFHPGDVEGAAVTFPELSFEIVHGGMAFTEETAWLLGRLENVWINLETLNIVLTVRPGVFAEMLAGLLSIGGEPAIDRLFWSSGAMNCHARPSLEAFMDFQFSDELLERSGFFAPVPQLTREHKRKILGGNAARLYGLDIPALAARIEDDEFSRAAGSDLPAPYSTTPLAGAVLPAEAQMLQPATVSTHGA
jgi:predicted TIM-barrel fold metal-dependent hydrolase